MTYIPDVKLKAMLQFPARVAGGTGIDVDQVSGTYTFNLDYSELSVFGSVPTAAISTTYYLGWNSVNNQYGLVPVQDAGMTAKVPTVLTATPATMGENDTSIIDTVAGATVITLLNPATHPGRMVYIKSTTSGAVTSATANVGALATGAISTAILAAAPGKWALLQSDGTYWQIIAGT